MTIRKEPTWDEGVAEHDYKGTIAKEGKTDIAIIGGGLAGVIAAYLLSKEGKRVTLLEKGKLGHGATGMTTAFLTQVIDTDITDLVKARGDKEAKEILGSHGKAIDMIEAIVREEGIDCDFARCSNYVYARNADEDRGMEDETAAMKEAGLKATYRKGGDFGFPIVSHIEIEDQAKFHPLKFLQALAGKALAQGASIIEHAEVEEIGGDGPYTVKTKDASIEAEWVIVATYQPLNQPLSLVYKKGMYTSFVYELSVPKGAIKEGTYEDTLNPYQYFRVDSEDEEGKDRMIIGGQDQREEIPMDPEKNFKALHDYINETFPGLEYEVNRKWSGPILESIDGLAYIGPADEGEKVLYSFGFSGNGMTYSVIAGLMHRDRIMGEKNAWADLFPASRIARPYLLALKGRDFTEEFIKGALKNMFKYKKGK